MRRFGAKLSGAAFLLAAVAGLAWENKQDG